MAASPFDPTSRVDLHEMMSEKRYRKYEFIVKKYSFVREYGDKDAEIGILAWGSVKGAIKEACMVLAEEGQKVGAMIPVSRAPARLFEVSAGVTQRLRCP